MKKERKEKRCVSRDVNSVSSPLKIECDHYITPVLKAFEVEDVTFYGIRGSLVRSRHLAEAGIGIAIELQKDILESEFIRIRGKHKEEFNFLTMGYDITLISIPVEDMHPVPFSYSKLRLFLHKLLEVGEDVGIACVGGHGRTGTLLAAFLGIAAIDGFSGSSAIERIRNGEDLITVLRESYCEKAIESRAQIVYLQNLFLDTMVKVEVKEEENPDPLERIRKLLW